MRKFGKVLCDNYWDSTGEAACTMHNMRFGIATAMTFLLLSACRHGAPTQTAPVAGASRPHPQTQAECKACNGVWGAHGLAQVTSCLCRTTNAGKRCYRHSDCQGSCVAGEEVEQEVVEAGPPARGYFIGRCAEFSPIFGCMRMLDQAGPGPLDQPPLMLCID
jgi:hypothetical protein